MTIPIDAPTPGIPTIIQLLSSVMAEVTHVGKGGWNTQQKFKYRGIDEVVNALGPALRKHGVVTVPVLEEATYRDILVGEKRTPMQQCTVKVRYEFCGPAGDHKDATVPGEAFDSGDKATAKAMSVAYRIALLQVFSLPTDDPDPDGDSYERAPQAVTDQTWLAGVHQRIDTAVDTAVLDRIATEITAQANDGKLATADGTALQARFDARRAQLRTEASQAPADDEWTKPAPPQPEQEQDWQAADWDGTRASQPQLQKIRILMMQKRGLGKDRDAVIAALNAMLKRDFPIASSKELRPSEADSIIKALKAEPNFVNGPMPPTDGRTVMQDLEMFIDNSDGPQQLHEAGLAIAEEFGKSRITEADRAALQERWKARNKQLNAPVGASA